LPSDAYSALPAPRNVRAAYGSPGSPMVISILDDGADGARVSVGFAASDMIIHRITRKPPVCDAPTPNTSLSNFDVFAANFAEHYPFFRERNIDWKAVVDSNRSKITEATPPTELFNILAGM